MVDIKEVLPIGSVVLLKNGIKKIMIIGTFQQIQRENQVVEQYDYIGVLYPEGLLNQESMMMFNHEQINDVIFKGYDNPERRELLEYIESKVNQANATQEGSLKAPNVDL